MMNLLNLINRNKENTRTKAETVSYTNNVTLTGRVVNVFATGKITIITMGIYSHKPNFPKILFFGDSRLKAAAFKVNDIVRVEGNIQSSVVTPGKGLKPVSVFGENIEAVSIENELDRYSDLNNINRFELTGMVMNRIDRNNVVKIFVRTYKNNHMSIVPVDYYCNDPDPLGDIRIGNVVTLSGCIQTKRKVFDDETVYFENYVASDIKLRDIPYTELEK